ncbi:MerR family transcriptional regulator [Pseudodesulfovibrio senegalensis]|jgi:DNA-binding transcriptional MerR regulator|uniref:MerR family transcriptional regulator n=1 Tax=Pseudodesulfovibrio senegalensis TaxID=1721087 RepID=A0A6N6N1R6_9BACT|nr:MerR family transcriptional regulator [Pseudodesulfovibrio senegalensis]KAB1440800.1 MerR family transcriptional regulator [Pseudodesulfovibrio senegalensis]
MTGKKLLSVAEIARELELPESTVHYWKNRFAQHLPSVGRGRQKRFRPEAVEIFSVISTMLKEGHTARDVMEHLSQSYPLQADAVPAVGDAPASGSGVAVAGMDGAMKMASAIGLEIARSIGEGVRSVLAPGAADSAELDSIREEVQQAVSRISASTDDVDALRSENAELKEKLRIMEAELVRIRKDRREMEKYLLDKIKTVTT